MARKAIAPVQAPALAISYVRFSTPQQSLGDSFRRQVEATAKYCADHGLTLDETLKDEASGYHAKHLKDGALGRFVERVQKGEIPPGSVLIVEALDRLSRQKPRIAQQKLLELVNAGVEVVTLMDGQRYSQDSLDANMSQLFTSIGIMIGAHSTSKNLAGRITDVWRSGRRGECNATNILPAWIIRTADGRPVASVKGLRKLNPNVQLGIIVDESKKKTIRRIFKMALTMGVEAIAKKLNAEGTPVLATNRKRSRGIKIWDKAAIAGLIRGKQVLGIQEIGRYENGKRVLTGEVIENAYLAVVSLEEWQAAKAAVDARQRGVGTGRNVIAFSNLFGGELARCAVCHGPMKIRGKGSRDSEVKYLGCSNAGVASNRCGNGRYFRCERVEADVFKLFHGLVWEAGKPDDKGASLTAQLDTITARMTKRQRNIDAIESDYADASPSMRQSLGRHHAEQDKDQVAKTKLERQLANLRAAKPADAHLAAVQSVSKRLERLGGAELVEARGKIAAALPALLDRLTFMPSGQIVAKLSTGKEIELGTVTGQATPDGFHVRSPMSMRAPAPGQPVKKPGPVVNELVPFRHPPVTRTALVKAAKEAPMESKKALEAFKASQPSARTEKVRKGDRAA